jgi:hypothetical protein
MLRYILVETTMFSSGDDPEETRKDLCWWLEALTQRNQDYLKQRPNTPRLYKSGVRYELPKQYENECEEVGILRAALGKAARQRDVARALDKIQQVLGGEHFCDIGTILKLGAIDCDGLACWRAAELRQAGIHARPFMTHRERFGGGTVYHALVLWPPFGDVSYETTEDPSLLLGMGGASRTAERAEEIRKNAERCDILRKRGVPSSGALENVLGLRKSTPMAGDVLDEINKMLRAA